MEELCSRCQGKGLCGKPCKILAKFKILGSKKLHFSGSSPPEIFIGRANYPQVNTGILSPEEYGDTEIYSLPELWHKNKFTIEQIINSRGKMIYARFKSGIKDARNPNRLASVMQEISLASKPVSTEFFLKKPASLSINLGREIPIIGNPAPLKIARLEENPKVDKKVEYLAGDTDVKASHALIELYNSGIQTSNIIKLLAAGMLGLKFRRKFVPTRWSITATDDTLSKFLLEKIKYYPEISEFLLFSSEYLGNHYEFLLLPSSFSFEVIEAKMTGSVWNPEGELYIAQDYESFSGRKDYASQVTGAYYSNRLALTEYLSRVKKQASCLVMRECRPEYYAPCGVGILREASRQAFNNMPEKFSSWQEALQTAQKRMRLPVSIFKEKSWLLKEHGKQTKLRKWF
jgi:hypothetical protein